MLTTRANLFALAAILLAAAPTAAQQQSVAGGTRARFTDRVVIGGGPGQPFGEVLRILGLPGTASGNGTMNPVVFDGDGDALRATGTSVTTGGAWFFANSVSVGTDLTVGNTGSFGGLVLFSGNTRVTHTTPTIDLRDSDAGANEKFARMIADGGTTRFQYLTDSNTSPVDALTFARSGTTPGLATFGAGAAFRDATAVSLAALGVNNARLGVASNAPRVILETVGSSDQWEMGNVNGLFRLVRMNSAGTVDNRPFQIDGNINVQPLGRRILPVEPYGVDMGSQQHKFGAAWFGDAYFDRLVTIENIGTIDNRWLIGSGNALDSDLSPSATTMITRYNNYVAGAFVYLQKFARTEFIKITAGPTLTNKITNGSFETGAATNWFPSGGSVSASAVTTKSFHGEYSMLVDASSSPSFVANGAFGFTTGVTYTVCFNARRVDGATMASGAVSIFMRDAFVDAAAQQTQTDGWARFCRTAVAGANATIVPIVDTKGVDMYLDAIQIEETTIEQPYSEYRASYTIARNQEITGVANQWYRGDGMFGVNDGWIDCYAIRGIKSATEQGPACVVNVRTGSNFNDWVPHAAWGNLRGIYGYATTTYGFAAGKQGDDYLTVDPTLGIRMFADNVNRFYIDASGNIQIGVQSTGQPQLFMSSSSLQFCAYNVACSIRINGTTGSIDMLGSLTVGQSGAIKSGATGYDTDTGYWFDCNFTSGACSPRFRIGTTTAGNSYLRWTGSALEIKSANVSLNNSGLVIAGVNFNSSWDPAKAYRFDFGDGGTSNGLAAYFGSNFTYVIELGVVRNGHSGIIISAQNTSNTDAAIILESYNPGVGFSRINFNSDRTYVNGSQTFTGACSGAPTVVTNGLIRAC